MGCYKQAAFSHQVFFPFFAQASASAPSESFQLACSLSPEKVDCWTGFWFHSQGLLPTLPSLILAFPWNDQHMRPSSISALSKAQRTQAALMLSIQTSLTWKSIQAREAVASRKPLIERSWLRDRDISIWRITRLLKTKCWFRMEFVSPFIESSNIYIIEPTNKLHRDPIPSAASQRAGQRVIRKRLFISCPQRSVSQSAFEWFKQPVVKQASGFCSPPLLSSTASSLVPPEGWYTSLVIMLLEADFINNLIPVVSQLQATNHMPLIHRKLASSVKLTPLISLRKRNNKWEKKVLKRKMDCTVVSVLN